MESGLKQRLIGAAVLVAIAVIFLPMLVKGPAPDSGVSDVPLDVPAAPQGDMQTRDLPLVVPDEAPADGVTGMPSRSPPAPADSGDALPMVDTASAARESTPIPADAASDAPAKAEPMLPASAAGGDYAVHFGAYASSVNADTVVSRLRAAKLPAWREEAVLDGKPAWRVRIGPYATRADAETARLSANAVGRQSGARVVALDADAALPAGAAPAVPVSQPKPLPAPAPPQVAKAEKPAEATKPAEKPAVPPPAAPTGAAGVGFAVQIGAFGNPAQAGKKRDDLRAAGFNAFTETVRTDKGALTRVLAGPVATRADADRLRAQVKSKTGTDGMVRAHP